MKAIYQPSGAAKEYGLWACNLYNGCSNRCDYCYNRHCPQSITLGGDTPTIKKSLCNEGMAYLIFCHEFEDCKEQIIRDGGLFFSFVSDPMLPETRALSMRCAEYAMFNRCPVTILTKCYVPTEWAERWKDYLKVGFTLTGMDEMEHSPLDTIGRMRCMQELHDKGVRTWASIEPVIDLNAAYYVFYKSLPFCDEYKIGLATKIGIKFDEFDVKYFVRKVENAAEGFYYTLRREEDRKQIYWKDSIKKYIGTDAPVRKV